MSDITDTTSCAYAQTIIDTAAQRLGIDRLNAMQQAAIAACCNGGEVILEAPTGSGKTLAYLIPLAAHLSTDRSDVQALVILPTRELARQVDSVARAISTGFKIACCHGGHPFKDEAASLSGHPTLVIGTPGRLLDHLHRGTLLLNHITTCVIDEYDKCLELGFLSEIEALVAAAGTPRLRILTSATERIALPDFLPMRKAIRLHFEGEALQGEVNDTLTVHTVSAPGQEKRDTLLQLLRRISDTPTLIFCNQREGVEQVAAFLARHRITCVAFHGGMQQTDRERALCRLRNGSAYICVATDLAARGLDIPQVAHIIHYDLPLDEAAYTHRNGRTARMNAHGTAYLIVAPHEELPPGSRRATELSLDGPAHTPAEPPMTTLHLAAGKREKIGRGDILGFLTQACRIPSQAVGLIEVKDHYAYVAVEKEYADTALQQARQEKIKGRRIQVSKAL